MAIPRVDTRDNVKPWQFQEWTLEIIPRYYHYYLQDGVDTRDNVKPWQFQEWTLEIM